MLGPLEFFAARHWVAGPLGRKVYLNVWDTQTHRSLGLDDDFGPSRSKPQFWHHKVKNQNVPYLLPREYVSALPRPLSPVTSNSHFNVARVRQIMVLFLRLDVKFACSCLDGIPPTASH